MPTPRPAAMRLAFVLLAAVLAGAACTARTVQDTPIETQSEFGIVLWQACGIEQARALEAAAADGESALRASACFASLLRREAEGPKKDFARRGLAQAEAAVAALPKSALAHYLAAYLHGMEAEQHPLRGLDLVPRIEQEALLAAGLDPGLDFGGPDRILGELYLRAPAFPVSVGDSAKAVEHYSRAATLAPDFAENRLGLAEALLADGDAPRACRELDGLARDAGPQRARAAELFARHCAGQGGKY